MLHLLTILTLLSLTSAVTYEGPGNLDCLGSPSVTCEFGSNLSLGTLQSGPTSVANFGGDDNNKNDFKVDIISGSVDCDGSCVFTADGAVPTPTGSPGPPEPTGSPGPPEPTAAPVSESPIVPPSSAPKIEFLVTAVVTTLAVFFVSINTA
mmetsp:Transcript_6970/g.11031  ORF Transcript_6970/g.11031 Transcript_6970/m.11031 type:complete len:151 (+) Transcript_6970:77-529(+)